MSNRKQLGQQQAGTPDAMRDLWFVGDPHGDFDDLVEAGLAHRPQTMVFLGDLCPEQPIEQVLQPLSEHGVEWYWISGNHDTDREDWYDHLHTEEGERRCLDGRVVTLPDGLRLAGLGGVFRGKVWDGKDDLRHETQADFMRTVKRRERFRDGLPLRHRSTIFRHEFLALAAQRADILVAHEAPRAFFLGVPAIDALAESLRAKLVVHGHHHRNLLYPQLGERQAYGLAGGAIMNMIGELILPGRNNPVWQKVGTRRPAGNNPE